MRRLPVLGACGLALALATLQSCATTERPASFAQELIVDGDFQQGLASWGTFLMNDAQATFNAVDGGVAISIIKTLKKSSGDIQLTQPKPSFPIEKGKTYRLRFDGLSGAGSRISVTIDENGVDINGDGFAYSPHAGGTFTLTDTMKTYQQDLTVNADNPRAGIIFLLGNAAGDLVIAHVSLRELVRE